MVNVYRNKQQPQHNKKIELNSEFLLRLNDSMLRGNSEAVSRPGQIKAQLSGGIVPNLNLTGGGCTI